jgi:hypothetical protein
LRMNMGESELKPLEALSSASELPQTKECPKCLKGTMELQVEVEGDEAPVGDPDSGDYEMGQIRTVFYECNNKCCKFTEVVNQEFKGSGILR